MGPHLEQMPQSNSVPHQEGLQLQPGSPEADIVQKLNMMARQRARNSCMTFLFLVIILILFFSFGGKVFGFFNILNVYHFIISVIIILIVYITCLGMTGLFIKYPRDLLNMVSERLRGN